MVSAGHGEPTGQISAAIAGLVNAGLVASGARRLALTGAGVDACRAAFGEVPGPSRTWTRLRDTRIMGMALGMDRASASTVARLGTAAGLRLAVVAQAFKVPARLATSEATLRSALAGHSLGRPPRGPRSIARTPAAEERRAASRLLTPPREAASDTHLIASLAMERTGARDLTAAALRRALIERLLPPPSPASTAEIPGPSNVIASARAVASRHARGIPGNRRILIADMIRHLRELHPGWRIEDTSLKAMLLDAHREGRIALASADLRSAADLAAIRASEVRHLSGAWHYIRVEDA
jgi:hypothetical protein